MNSMNNNIEKQNKLVVFQNKNIRRIWHKEEWFYSVIDIIEILTNSKKPRDYWYRVKKRAGEEEKMELSTICRQLKIESKDGKKYATEISKKEKPETFTKNKKVARRGGKVAGKARKETEKELGRSIISDKNFLDNDNKLELKEKNNE